MNFIITAILVLFILTGCVTTTVREDVKAYNAQGIVFSEILVYQENKKEDLPHNSESGDS